MKTAYMTKMMERYRMMSLVLLLIFRMKIPNKVLLKDYRLPWRKWMH